MEWIADMKRIIALVVGIFMLLLCAGVITTWLASSAVSTTLPEDEVASPTPAKKGALPSLKPGLVTEGIWEVKASGGVAPGTYRVSVSLAPDTLCYWQISTDGAGEDILKNNVETGGTPQVVLKSGQWFKTQGCGTWERR